MSRAGLKDFLHAVDHSSSLRHDVRCCADRQALIRLANSYGFAVNDGDIQADALASKVQQWFDTSTIKPFTS